MPTGSSFTRTPSSEALGAFSQMPKGGPPVMGGGDWYSVGSWNTPPTGQTLTDWNAWLSKLGVPQNTFSQFSVNPKLGQYALRNTYTPPNLSQATKGPMPTMSYSDYARNNLFSPMQQLNPVRPAKTPISTTPTVTRSTLTLPSYNSTVPVAPTFQATAPSPAQRFTFPSYYGSGNNRFRRIQ